MEILDYVFGDNYLAASSLPPELEKKAAALRGAGPVDEDPVRAALERARIDKVAVADGSKVLKSLVGEASEEVDALAHARLAKTAVDLSVEGIRHRTLLEKFCGSDDEFAATGEVLAKSLNPTLRKAGVDPTWSQVLTPASTDARLAGPQRHDDVFRRPQVAEGEPLAHEDGAVTRTWPEGSTTVIWKDGKIIASRTQYQSADGTEVEFYDGTGDEISEGEYAAVTRV